MTTAPHIEPSTENLLTPQLPRPFSLKGLEDIPRSIIPVTFYKFVQPHTEKAYLPNGQRASNGNFLMSDVRESVSELNIVILRAKRATRIQYTNNIPEKVVSLKILGINVARQKPFILSVPITSFGSLGQVFEELESRGATNAWDYGVTLTSTEINKQKTTPEGVKNVTYFVINAIVNNRPLTEEAKKVASECYQDFAAKLDTSEEVDELEEIAGKTI